MKMKGVKITLLLSLLCCSVAFACIACTTTENSGDSAPVSEISESSGIALDSVVEVSQSESSSSSFEASSKREESSNLESSSSESSESTSEPPENSSTGSDSSESSSSEALPHIHEYKSQVLREPTCEEKGIVRYTCACGECYTETPEALGHVESIDPAQPSTCVSHGLSEGSHCSRCQKTLVAQESLPLVAHTYQYGYCSVCNLTGLTFSINHESNYAICTGYTCKSGKVRRVEIPDTYYGYPVRELAANLFASCRDLYSVEIGENVEIIGESAFYGCDRLSEIYDRSKVQISKCEKSKNGLLTEYFADENIHYAPFESKIKIENDCVLLYEDNEVRLLTYLGTSKKIVIPDGVTRLLSFSFRSIEAEEIVIPTSVNYIEKQAFFVCTELKRVVFSDPNHWEARGHDHSVCEEGKIDKYEENMPNWTPFEPGDLDTPENGKKAIVDLFNVAEWRKVN